MSIEYPQIDTNTAITLYHKHNKKRPSLCSEQVYLTLTNVNIHTVNYLIQM
jgi:hypothetical protein